MTDTTDRSRLLITLTVDIISAHLSNNSVTMPELAALIENVYAVLTVLGQAPAPDDVPQQPAVSIRASVKPDYLVCLEDGKKVTMLKRYLMTNYRMTPQEYRTKWRLAGDYPMVAPNYAQKRRELAKQIGLGRKSRAAAVIAAPVADAPKPRRRAPRVKKEPTPAHS
ncbi:MucR family transcriptional regulator [Novosphingobium resinovorum]|uniref:MucR family transcriptional regulator n=1 Tax=Novosphingobium resinovorum TaxID=158500 RepID=UPI002ED518E7|nr:MucR family transcriptional regulator [Novosphingobium resinovorum]